MKKIQKPSPLTFLFLNILWLTGCSESEYDAISCKENTTQTSGPATCATPDNATIGEVPVNQSDYIEKSGVTGQILGTSYWVDATICFDNNLNAICDPSEPSALSYEQGKYSFDASDISTSISAKSPLLAIKNGQQIAQPIILSAPTPNNSTDKNINITVFTTLVMSETEFNPFALADADQARNQLQTGSFIIGNISALIGQDYISAAENNLITQADQIAISLNQAQSLTTTERYKSIAAVVDKMYQQESYITNITLEEINAQDIQSEGVNINLSSPAVSWVIDDEDEVSMDLSILDGFAIIGSKWHNRLTVLDLANDTPEVISQNNFASSPGGRDDYDALSGATEQVLSNISITPEASGNPSVLVSVERHKDGNSDVGVGLYRADLSNPDVIPEKRFGEDLGSSDYYEFANLNAMALSADGSTVILSSDENTIAILNSADFSEKQRFSFNEQVRTVALNEAGNIAYAALFGARTGMATLNVDTGAEISFIATGSQYPNQFLLFENNTKIAWYLRKGTTLFIYDISKPADTPIKLNEIPVSSKIKSFAISDDEKLVLVAINGGRIALYSLTDAVPHFLEELQVEDNSAINSVEFFSNARAIISLKNKVQVLDANISLPSNWSSEQKLAWLMAHRTPPS